MSELPKKVAAQLERMDAAFEAVEGLLFRLGLQGLQRASRSSADELRAVSQTAHNAGMIVVERQLDALATHVRRYLDHDPLFSMRDYRRALSRAWLSNRAARRRREAGELPEDMLDVLGEARRRYVELDAPLTVQPLGAAGWVSETAYVGVTVYVRSESHGVLQATTARPTMHFGEDPRGLYGFELPGDLGLTLRDLAHGAWTLQHAKVSRDGRLSMHGGLEFEAAAYQGARAYAGLWAERWPDLVTRLREASVHPVAGADSILACVQPASLHPLDVDVKRQVARAELVDAGGARLWLEVALKRENNLLVDNLERLLGTTAGAGRTAPPPTAFFGRVQAREGRLVLAPFTAVFEQAVRLSGRRGLQRVNLAHLALESLKGARAG